MANEQTGQQTRSQAVGRRVAAVGRGIGGVFAAIGRALGGFFRWIGRGIGRLWRLGTLDRRVRALEHERRQVFENLGKMVYVLHKRNLVRNPDLLAECQEIREIDLRIDELLAESDRVRVARGSGTEPAPQVAETPAEYDAAARASAEPTPVGAPAAGTQT